MATLLESFDEFAHRQNCDRVVCGSTISRNGHTLPRFVFANGAVSDGNYGHAEPPDDAMQRLRLKRQYVQNKLSVEEREFRRFKEYCVTQGQAARRFNVPGPPSDAPEKLRAGADRIQKLREQLAELNTHFEDPAHRQRDNRVQASIAQGQYELAQLQTNIQNVHI